MTAQPRHLTALRVVLCAAFLLVVSLAAPAAARADSIFSVAGRGWGHGIGMTQYGAMGYAQQGKAYDWILAHYFQQTTLATRVELTVKVDLDAGKAARSSWRIAAASVSTTLTVTDYTNGARSIEVTRGASVWMTFKAGGAVLSSDKYDSVTKTHSVGSVVATFSGSVIAATGAAATSEVRILGTSGAFSQANIAWRGRIRFTPVTTTGHAIDYVPMEQYLRGVVPRESPSSWPVEALRAQAVAARSYAYGSALSGSVLWCTTASQVYNGADDGPNNHESAKTDAAVADTANQFVVYGSGVVQTFFSSSSGGRTANSKDVWFSSRSDNTSPVYYTSVPDADDVGGNPNYRWTLSDMTGTKLAGYIRTHYASLAQPSPATVTKVTLEPGTSGYVRYVTLHWSKGSDTTLTGPQFQHALGLKSSAFTVTLKNPPSVATALTLASSETTVQAGASFVLSGALSPGRIAQVTVQHKFPGSSTWVTFATLTTRSDGTFSCTTGTRSPGTSQYRVLCAAATGWLASTSPVRSVAVVGTVTSLTLASSEATVGAGASFVLSGTLSPGHGGVVTMQHKFPGSSTWVSFRTLTTKPDGTFSSVTGTRSLGTHQYRAVYAASGGWLASTAPAVSVAIVKVPPPVWKRYEQNTSSVSYVGAWSTSKLAGLSGGTHAFSRQASATATFTFTGSKARWIGKRAANYGKAWVSVDGAKPVLIDLYSAKTLNQQRLFESATLQMGTHELTVRVAGTKNPKATNHYVDVDAFEALHPGK
ncbi:MAG TPA: SpoIID/LytB domain-containing protein [Coriobacteriia bacterium]